MKPLNQSHHLGSLDLSGIHPDLDWIQSRVTDGKFNNSKFVQDRYCILVEHHIDESDMKHFSKVGFKEFMLDRRMANQVKFKKICVHENS